jgi:AcrR family transcriptional regulator
MTAVDPTTGLPDGWARRRARVASEIEHGALELFAAVGPDNVTVEQVAQAAGISVRTFFRYFRNCDDVMFSLPRRLVHELCVRVAARPTKESVLEAFIAAVHGAQDAPIDDDLVRLWGQAMRTWAVVQSQPRPSAGMADAYGEVIAARLGVGSDDARVEVMATAIASVMWLAFLRWLSSEGTRPLTAVVEESFEVLAQLSRAADERPQQSVSSST